MNKKELIARAKAFIKQKNEANNGLWFMGKQGISDLLVEFAEQETTLLSKHILELQSDKGKLIDENRKLKLDKECCHCVYSDSPCVPDDYDKKDNGYCSHYKNVFEENRQLKNKLSMIGGTIK